MEPTTERGAAGQPPRTYRDLWAVAAILAFCAAAYAVTLTFDTVPDSLAQGLQPAGFPQLVLATMAIMALFVGWEQRRGSTDAPPPVDRMVYRTSALILATVPVLIWVDFFIAITIATFAMGWMWGERRLVWLAVYSVLQTVFIYIIFSTILRVHFPHGILVDFLA